MRVEKETKGVRKRSSRCPKSREQLIDAVAVRIYSLQSGEADSAVDMVHYVSEGLFYAEDKGVYKVFFGHYMMCTFSVRVVFCLGRCFEKSLEL